MRVLAIIPARMGASRFSGKPLEKLLGMPMIGHCYFRAKIALGQDNVWIATCDDEFRSYSQTIGAKAIDTSAKHTRATGRTAEALESIELIAKLKFEIILMVQADAPLVIPDDLTCMLSSISDPRVTIVNLMCKAQSRAHFYDKNNFNVVVNNAMYALYFSREPIPSDWKNLDNIPQYIQTGVFAFRREAQLHLNYLPETLHEIAESVDINRVIEAALSQPHSPSARQNLAGYLSDFSATQTALEVLPTAAQVAASCVFLASTTADAITGQCINVDCGVMPQ